MKKCFKIALVSLHVISCAFTAIMLFARYIFFREWPITMELTLWIIAATTFSLHYVLLFAGQNKNAVSDRVLHILQIIEIVIFGAQFILLCIAFIIGLLETLAGWSFPKIEQYWPIAMADIAVLIVRKVYINCQGSR